MREQYVDPSQEDRGNKTTISIYLSRNGYSPESYERITIMGKPIKNHNKNFNMRVSSTVIKPQVFHLITRLQ
jgi:hypothetical protein